VLSSQVGHQLIGLTSSEVLYKELIVGRHVDSEELHKNIMT
jgi:hypothetical protein